MSASPYVDFGAELSDCGRYRYRLWREWRGTHDPVNWRWLHEEDGSVAKDGAGYDLGEPLACVFVMLNPSTADATKDDPTIRRCVGFAKRWNYERVEVINLFAFRSTDPATLLALNHDDDPVGPDNLAHVDRLLPRAGIIIAAWGAHGAHLGQDETMLGWLGCPPRKVHALGLTKDGHPRHPLYLPSNAEPVPYRGRR